MLLGTKKSELFNIEKDKKEKKSFSTRRIRKGYIGKFQSNPQLVSFCIF